MTGDGGDARAALVAEGLHRATCAEPWDACCWAMEDPDLTDCHDETGAWRLTCLEGAVLAALDGAGERAHEFAEDVADASMCVCGRPALGHDGAGERGGLSEDGYRPCAGCDAISESCRATGCPAVTRTAPPTSGTEESGLRAAVAALCVRWEREADERGPEDRVLTAGVAAMLRAALADHAAEGA